MEFYTPEIRISLTFDEMELLQKTGELLQTLYFGMKEKSCDYLNTEENGDRFYIGRIDDISGILNRLSNNTLYIN